MLDWPHAPLHRFDEAGTYFVTAGTYQKQHFFNTAKRLDDLCQRLATFAERYRWLLQSWSVFSNHYHFVAASPEKAKTLREMLRDFHSGTSRELNRLDGKIGRRVWHEYWDTQLTYERSYLARLNYVQQNPVHHGLVAVATDYRWCSAAWFERTGSPAFVKTVASFRTDRLFASERFEPVIVER